MNPYNASISFQAHSNGTATVTFNVTDALGNPTTLPAGTPKPDWGTSNRVVTVQREPDGMTALLKIDEPAERASGVIITAQTTVAGGHVVSGKSGPIKVVDGTQITGYVIEQ
jgi:hypothetical protein